MPFYESEKAFSDKISEFFTAVENFNQALAWDSGVDSLAFAIMVCLPSFSLSVSFHGPPPSRSLCHSTHSVARSCSSTPEHLACAAAGIWR